MTNEEIELLTKLAKEARTTKAAFIRNAIEKQTPKEAVIKFEYPNDICPTKCPSCGWPVLIKFCGACGQAIEIKEGENN